MSFSGFWYVAWVMALLIEFGVLSDHSLALAVEASPELRRIPDEVESVGGHSLGFAHGGMAALTGIPAVRINPALMVIQRQYVVSTGYNWPTYGRNFYHLGVVDAQTSSVAAGVSFTGYQEDVKHVWQKQRETSYDSPVNKRLTLALAQVIGRVTAGVQGTYITTVKPEGFAYNKVTSATFGLGVAGLVTPQIRFGLSAENLSNEKVAFVAPTTYRAAVAFMLGRGDFTAHVDLRHRQRLEGFETNTDRVFYSLASQEQFKSSPELTDPEILMIGSFSARVYNLVRLIGGYGTALGAGDERRLLSGGVALVHSKFSISYSLARPYLVEQATQAHFNIDFGMNI